MADAPQQPLQKAVEIETGGKTWKVLASATFVGDELRYWPTALCDEEECYFLIPKLGIDKVIDIDLCSVDSSGTIQEADLEKLPPSVCRALAEVMGEIAKKYEILFDSAIKEYIEGDRAIEEGAEISPPEKPVYPPSINVSTVSDIEPKRPQWEVSLNVMGNSQMTLRYIAVAPETGEIFTFKVKAAEDGEVKELEIEHREREGSGIESADPLLFCLKVPKRARVIMMLGFESLLARTGLTVSDKLMKDLMAPNAREREYERKEAREEREAEMMAAADAIGDSSVEEFGEAVKRWHKERSGDKSEKHER
jgi:hypothetical protein